MGYAGGAGALVTMGAEAAGVDVGNYPTLNKEWKGAGSPGKFHEWEKDRHDYPELLRLRDAYRDASPATVRFWKDCARAWDIASSGKGVRGSSPLARGARERRGDAGRIQRLIPARAGSTQVVPRAPSSASAHPRSRGEHMQSAGHLSAMAGSSPLARGALLGEAGAADRRGLIPARAGSTSRGSVSTAAEN